MASRKQKNQMTQFVADRLEESTLYDILSKDHEHVVVVEKPIVRVEPITTDVFVHNRKTTAKELAKISGQNYSQNIYTAHVILKDGKVGFVRLADKESWRLEESLKKYSAQEVNQMLHLRDREKWILGRFENIVYYQPETQRLPESVRVFGFETVQLDYSHVHEGHPSWGFVTDGPSKDYKLAVDKGLISVAKLGLSKSRYPLLGQLVQK